MVRMPLRYSYPRSSSVLRPSASTLALVAGVLAAVLTVANVAVTIRAVTRLDQLLPVAHTYSTPSLPSPPLLPTFPTSLTFIMLTLNHRLRGG